MTLQNQIIFWKISVALKLLPRLAELKTTEDWIKCHFYFEIQAETDAQFIDYLNCNDGLPTADHFLMFSPSVRAGWRREMSSSRYVLSNEKFYETIRFK